MGKGGNGNGIGIIIACLLFVVVEGKQGRKMGGLILAHFLRDNSQNGDGNLNGERGWGHLSAPGFRSRLGLSGFSPGQLIFMEEKTRCAKKCDFKKISFPLNPTSLGLDLNSEAAIKPFCQQFDSFEFCGVSVGIGPIHDH